MRCRPGDIHEGPASLRCWLLDVAAREGLVAGSLMAGVVGAASVGEGGLGEQFGAPSVVSM